CARCIYYYGSSSSMDYW
nr:immunoglobulin heavy chain junction region [Mus musculus]